MSFTKKLLFLLSIMVTAMIEVKTQPMISPTGITSQNQAYISIGLEPELILTLGYTHCVARYSEKLDFHIGASIKFAPLILENKPFRINIHGPIDWEMTDQWKTRFSPGFYWAHDDNRAAVMNGLGLELRSATLHIGKSWAKGIELGWQYTGLTHIMHSTETKNTFNDRYPPGENGIDGPKDGWYRSTASRFRFGFAGSRKFGEHWGIQLGIGALLSVQEQGILLGFSHAQVPIYIETSIAYNY